MFKLEINTSSKSFGETDNQKRATIATIIDQAKQIIGSGRQPEPLRCPNGEVVGSFTLD